MECDGNGALDCQELWNNKPIFKANYFACYQKLGFSEYLQGYLYANEGNTAVHHVEAGS